MHDIGIKWGCHVWSSFVSLSNDVSISSFEQKHWSMQIYISCDFFWHLHKKGFTFNSMKKFSIDMHITFILSLCMYGTLSFNYCVFLDRLVVCDFQYHCQPVWGSRSDWFFLFNAVFLKRPQFGFFVFFIKKLCSHLIHFSLHQKLIFFKIISLKTFPRQIKFSQKSKIKFDTKVQIKLNSHHQPLFHITT